MAAQIEPPSIRISLIAGRYLIFDPAAAAVLRRNHNTCGNLVGALPQQPVQNVFLGMPTEIRPGEAEALVQRGAAHVVDNVAAHKAALIGGAADRRKYIDSLRSVKTEMHKVGAEQHAERAAKRAQILAKSKKTKSKKDEKESSSVANHTRDDSGLFEQPSPKPAAAASQERLPLDNWAVTLTTSEDLLPPESNHDFAVGRLTERPLIRFLQDSGYYMTPGLRFGCKYSVYPGDVLRFHAHYMVNDYDWNEAIPILDLVETGRLATAVKKSFLFGGEDQDHESPSGDGSVRTCSVRTYSLEWAGM